MINQIKLIINLMKDRRVHPLIKALPILAVVYLIVPDLVPGPFDDAVVIPLFMQIFLSLIPDELIEELRYEQDIKEKLASDKDTIIEGEFWEE
jgi:hypothetical protein